MMYYINKIVLGLANPMSVGLVLLGAALIFWIIANGNKNKCRFFALVFGVLSFGWLLVWSSPLLMPNLGMQLERCYPPIAVETLPNADAIVLLGGGMTKGDGEAIYPEMHEAADRVWHAARLWKAGKAQYIFTSGTNEAFASSVLLKDLGIPSSAIRLDPEARNTEENAKFVASFLKRSPTQLPTQPSTLNQQLKNVNSTVNLNLQPQPKILLVTSAWHMRRALLMFQKYAPDLEIIPAACDYKALNFKDEFSFEAIFPSIDCMSDRNLLFKEILGYYGYKWLRK